MNTGKLITKKSKKRKPSDEPSSSDYEEKPSSKLRKLSKGNKRQRSPKKKSQKSLIKYGLSSSSESDSQHLEEKKKNITCISIELFNVDKIFTEILNKASRQPDFLIMLKNLLSGCSRVINDKRNMYIKKWRTLRSSNCSQQQYLTRQAELKRAQNDQNLQMQRDIMTKLSYANIRGFETRNSLIQSYKRSIKVENQNNQQNFTEYEIDDEAWQRYYQTQKKLLSMMMKENDFVSQDYTPSNLIKTYSQSIKDKEQVIKEQVFQDNQLGVKFNNIDSEENPQATQFLFSKHYKQIDYNKVFTPGLTSFKVLQIQKFYMESKAMSWLLQLKSDQIYQNDTFQRQSYRKYSDLLKQIYNNPSKFTDSEIISHLLQIGAYILNAVHYYQKFKLKCDLLHPLQLLLVIEKVKKNKLKSNDKNNYSQMIDEKYEYLEKQTIKISKALEQYEQITLRQ